MGRSHVRSDPCRAPWSPTNDDPTAGSNPPGDAVFNYWLKSAPQCAPTITVLDAAGKAVRTLTGTRKAGLNRVWWNLNNEPTKTADVTLPAPVVF